MENLKVKGRKLTYIADFDGQVADILEGRGISSSICTALRKEMGLVCKISGGEEIPIRLTERLSSGESFCIYLVDSDVKEIPKWDVPIDIVYQDEDIAVIDKKAGMAVIPVKGFYRRSLANALANIWGDFVYRPVNRLDRDTSGLMIVAKNQLAHSMLAKGHIHRQYVGLCQGVFAGERTGVLDMPIKRIDGGMKRCVGEGGERAVTSYEIMTQYEGYFSARFILQTGRTHQIRVHMSHIGYPLCCDKLYNPTPQLIICPNGITLDRQALHSCKLEFTHPISGKDMSFISKSEFLNEV